MCASVSLLAISAPAQVLTVIKCASNANLFTQDTLGPFSFFFAYCVVVVLFCFNAVDKKCQSDYVLIYTLSVLKDLNRQVLCMGRLFEN